MRGRTPLRAACALLIAALCDLPNARAAAPAQTPPPTVTEVRTDASQAAAPDIGGIWEQDPEPVNRYGFDRARILLVAFGGQYVALSLTRLPYLGIDRAFLAGHYASADSFEGSVRDFNDSGTVHWYKAQIGFPSVDHLRIAVPDLKEEKRFTRTAKIAPGGLDCDARKPPRVSATEATARSLLYPTDSPGAACWAYIGAIAGSPSAQVSYGDALANGRNVAKDESQAFHLYQLSGMQGDYFGALRLTGAFASGHGAPASTQRKNYWSARADWLDPDFVHTGSFLRITQWAADTAGHCDPSNPDHKSGDAIWRSARVAFEARDGTAAACWYRLASEMGQARADVYLGVMNMFGLGVARDQAAGLRYVKKAADAGDLFGLMYLSDFYHYGIGTPVDAQWTALLQRVLRDRNGSEVLSRVRGVHGINLDAAAATRDSADAERCASLRRANTQTLTTDERRFLAHCPAADITPDDLLAPGEHTVEHPEEILPEVFDPLVLPTTREFKQRASAGWVRLTP